MPYFRRKRLVKTFFHIKIPVGDPACQISRLSLLRAASDFGGLSRTRSNVFWPFPTPFQLNVRERSSSSFLRVLFGSDAPLIVLTRSLLGKCRIWRTEKIEYSDVDHDVGRFGKNFTVTLLLLFPLRLKSYAIRPLVFL